MTKEEILNKLQIYNDDLFKFDPIRHRYTYDNKHYISVTQFISKFHKPFDSDFWSKKKADERGISKEEILKEWKEKNDRANFIGTSTHDHLENYFNKIWKPLPTDLDVIDRVNKFNILYAKTLHKLEPVCFENRIYSKRWGIAGMIDSIFLNKNKIYIIDYKTNGDFTHDDHPKGKYEYLLYPFDFMHKNHLNEYSIQISLYILILEEIGIKIDDGFLLYIGPDDSKIYKIRHIVDILRDYLNKNNLIQ